MYGNLRSLISTCETPSASVFIKIINLYGYTYVFLCFSCDICCIINNITSVLSFASFSLQQDMLFWHLRNGAYCFSEISSKFTRVFLLMQFSGISHQISLVVQWSVLLTTTHEVPGSIPGSTIGIFLVGGGSPW